MREIKPDSVDLKMYRAREHFEELERIFNLFYTGHKDKILGLRRVGELMAFNATIAIPARIPLIVGDCLQNMRSSLDYLIWELVKANGGEPNRMHMFPICMKESTYRKAIKAERLLGVNDEAAAVVEALQPYHFPEAQKSRQMLAVLDELTNTNKHRHILGTLFEMRTPTPGIIPRHYLEAQVSGTDESGCVKKQTILTYIAFEDTSVKSIEIAGALGTIYSHLVEDVFPHFEKFFN